jgi:hypothetical protein
MEPADQIDADAWPPAPGIPRGKPEASEDHFSPEQIEQRIESYLNKINRRFAGKHDRRMESETDATLH